MVLKPLIRWTIGPVSKSGFQILRHSVTAIKRLYGEKFKYTICFNNLSNRQKKFIEGLDCHLLDQSDHQETLSLTPPTNSGGPAWKLYPPRISINTTEIFMDNDLVIFNESWFMEKFTDDIFYTESLLRSYGRFNSQIEEGFNLNSGLVVIPPGLDLGKHLDDNIQKFKINDWTNHFDEQALFASVVQDLKNIMIPLTDVGVDSLDGKYGVHFIGANSGKDELWSRYLIEKFKL
jgi:hypothetical protein